MYSKLRDLIRASSLRYIFMFNDAHRDDWVASQASQISAGSRVLDLGAGSAPYRRFFQQHHYRTQDFKQLDAHQLRNGAYASIDFVCDASAIPVEDGAFDVVVCTEMLEHVPEPIAIVNEAARVLKPGGILLLTAPLGSGVHQEPFHFYGGYTVYWYQRFLGAAGFERIDAIPNGGFFRLFGQESIRFLRLSSPTRMRGIKAALWLPLWLVLFPMLGLIIPLLAPWLDWLDKEKRFTVGYFVRAKKSV